jgi:hypothetical protein
MAITKIQNGWSIASGFTAYNTTVDELITGASRINGLVQLEKFGGGVIDIELPITKNTLIDGGVISIDETNKLIINISEAVYTIDSENYLALASSVTLTQGDVTYNRIDAIVATTGGTFEVIEGTAAAVVVSPSVPRTQCLISYIYVQTGADTSGGTSIYSVIGDYFGTSGNTLTFDSNGLMIETDIVRYDLDNSSIDIKDNFKLTTGDIITSGFIEWNDGYTGIGYNSFLNTLALYSSIDGTNGSVLRLGDTQIEMGAQNGMFSGATYMADYSANFTDRSLVDKEYVDNTYLQLAGGTMTGDGYIYWDGGDGGIGFETNKIVIYYQGISDNSTLQILENNINIIGGNVFSFSGATYADDYSANYTNRSLVDKAFVEGYSGRYNNVRKITSTQSALTTDYIVWSDGGTYTYTLPDAATSEGREIIVKKYDGANTLTVDTAGGNIDGSASVTFGNNTYVSRVFVSNGTNWMIIANV